MAVRISRSRLPIFELWLMNLVKPFIYSYLRTQALRQQLDSRNPEVRCQYWHSIKLSANHAEPKGWISPATRALARVRGSEEVCTPSLLPVWNQSVTEEFPVIFADRSNLRVHNRKQSTYVTDCAAERIQLSKSASRVVQTSRLRTRQPRPPRLAKAENRRERQKKSECGKTKVISGS